jgi:hypothetical protein
MTVQPSRSRPKIPRKTKSVFATLLVAVSVVAASGCKREQQAAAPPPPRSSWLR